MNLSLLIARGVVVTFFDKEIPSFTGLALDSRKVEEGNLFVAIPGTHTDGSVFISQALENGATGVLVTEGSAAKLQDLFPHICFFESHNVRHAASCIAALFYSEQPDSIVAVTGTNGKTSVVSFMRQLWYELGVSGASMGTLGVHVAGEAYVPAGATLTTPDPIFVHETLSLLKKRGIDYVGLEASSHGIHQHRLDSVHLSAAIFTNLSNDHLDYHHTLESYLDAKLRLFSEVMRPGMTAIVNADSPFFERIKDIAEKNSLRLVSFGKEGADIQLLLRVPSFDGQSIIFKAWGEEFNLHLPLVGEFQAYNVLAALAGVVAVGANIHEAVSACAGLHGVPGRLERVSPGVYVDYAHTPEALEKTLLALRAHTQGDVNVLFGCGGERDASKRPMMGAVAEQCADRIYVTDDNPRHEDPASIRAQIMETCPKGINIDDRRKAIARSIAEMSPGDMLLIAGKGHETYQLVGDTMHPFNDAEEVRKVLA